MGRREKKSDKLPITPAGCAVMAVGGVLGVLIIAAFAVYFIRWINSTLDTFKGEMEKARTKGQQSAPLEPPAETPQ